MHYCVLVNVQPKTITTTKQTTAVIVDHNATIGFQKPVRCLQKCSVIPAAVGQKRENTREEVCPSQGSCGYTFSDVRLAKAKVTSHWCHQQVKSATLYHNILIIAAIWG